MHRLLARALLLMLGLHWIPGLHAQDRLLPVYRFQRLEGMFSNQIRSRVVRDREGYAWIGTLNGLARFDSYAVKVYHSEPDNPRSISSNIVNSLLQDSRHRLWVGTYDAGLSLYDRAADRFVNFLPRADDSLWYRAKGINTIIEDRNSNLWLASSFGGVVRVTLPRTSVDLPAESLLTQVRFTTYPLGTPQNFANDVVEDPDGRILIASDKGLLVLDPRTGSISRLKVPSTPGHLLDESALICLCRDSSDVLWVGSKAEGLFRVDMRTSSVKNFRHRMGDTLSLLPGAVNDVVPWEGDHLWLGTASGLQLFSPALGRGQAYLTVGPSPNMKSYYTMLSVDNTGTLWVGTSEKGMYWLTGTSRRVPCFGLPDHTGAEPIIFDAIEKDRTGNLWFGSGDRVFQIDPTSRNVNRTIDVYRGRVPTYADRTSFMDRHGTLWYSAWGLGLFRIDLGSGRVRLYGSEAGLGPDRTINGIAQASGDSLWIAAVNDGLLKFDPVSGVFCPVPGLVQGNVWWLTRDSQGLVWVTSMSHGVFILNPESGTVSSLRHDPTNSRSLSTDVGRTVYQDPGGTVWIGAGNTIHRWDPLTAGVIRYINPGFPQALFAQPLVSDGRGRLWVDFLHGGLAVLDPTTGQYENYDVFDGVTRNLNVAVTLGDGRILLAGSPGLNIFHPDSLTRHRPPPPLVLTRMTVNDNPVAPPLVHSSPVPMELSYAQNVIELEFAAVDLDVPGQVDYQYRLEGLEEEWVAPQARRFVRYTGLSPREYVFMVKAVSRRGEWPDQHIALALTILPPWYRTAWAYAAYGILALSVLYAGYRLRLNQFRLQQQAELEHFQAKHLAEIDQLKSRFFANISHEFRTPLTLILGPAKQLLEGPGDEETKAKADLIHRSARKLNRLVGELLDISKIEAGEMKLQAQPTSVVPLLEDVVLSFRPVAERKKIAFSVRPEERDLIAWIDREKFDRILGNVLSNAFKFTPEGGTVTVDVVRRGGSPSGPAEGGFVEIAISDTGIGIPADKLEKIFDRFYQVDGGHTREHEGTGIGLSLTKELVALHKGRIDVESEEGKGSTFRVLFPLGNGHLKPEDIVDVRDGAGAPVSGEIVPDEAAAGTPGAAPAVEHADLPCLLLVEDNADVRAYISTILEGQYRIVEAKDGEEGLNRAYAEMPDLVISDIMMPKLDGFQFCRKLKTDVRTSHIPVILVTAKATMDDKINGLGVGADEYIMKPFEAAELKARVDNLLAQRRRLHEYFRQHGHTAHVQEKITSADQKFLNRAMEVMQEHLSDTSFGVEAFAEKMAVSRSLLLKKLDALTGEPPSELIRRTRLQQAARLLEARAGNVSEVALEVGFNNPSYFAECFRKQFGVSPARFRPDSRHFPSDGEDPHLP